MMQIVRKLLLLPTIAIAALALGASPASAQLQVFPEPGKEPCPEVTISVHHVEGGCHIEIASTQHKELIAYTPAPIVLSKCDIHIEARIGPDGEGWVSETVLTTEDPPTTPSCTRAPCDEPTGEQIPWPIHISEDGPSEEVGEMRLCLRPITSPPGSVSTYCTLHVPMTDLGGHEYEFGGLGDTFCEPGDFPFPLSIQDFGFTYEEDSEHLEVIH